MLIDGSKFCKQFLKKVTQGTNLWNCFKIWTAVSGKKNFQTFLRVRLVQETPINQSHVYWQIKISRKKFATGHQRNISMKLFQNLTSFFREGDLLRISSCRRIVQVAPFTRAMFIDESKFRKQLLKKVAQGTFLWNYFKIWKVVQRRRFFKKSFMSVQCKLPSSPELCLLTNQNFANKV